MRNLLRDARFLELQFLARLEREASITEQPTVEDTPHRRMLVHLLEAGYVNDVTRSFWHDSVENVFEGWEINRLQRRVEQERWHDIARILSARNPVNLRISHRGSLRRAELEQTLKTGRSLEPFGILVDGRYCDRDITIAILAAESASPVGVAFLDMNGLKVINDSLGHDAGDAVIKTFLRVVRESVEELGEAYRVGGDEVVVIMQGTVALMEATLQVIARKLARERPLGEKVLPLTVSMGLASTVDHTASAQQLRERADKARGSAYATESAEPRFIEREPDA